MSSRPSRGAARLAAILDALPDALLLVNCNGTVVNANTIALETFEAPGTALVGRGLLDLLPTFDSKRIPGSMRRPDEDAGEVRTKPTRMIARRTDGTEMLVEVTSANLEDGRTPYESAFEAAWADHRSYTGDELLMLVVRDLSETLDVEAELARQQRQTEMILRAAAEGVVGVDSEGRVVLVNPSAAQILGYRASELGGQELHPLIHHSRPDGSALPWEETPLSDSLRSGRKHRVRGQVLWTKNGRAVPVDLTTAPVRDGDQLVGAVMTFTDRRATDALRARHQQLLAVLDHSLRGPLEQLRAELGTLADDPAGQLWPEANQVLHHLSAGYARMTALVDNVLSYQRLDAGAERLRRERVSLDGVVSAGVEGAVELIGPGRAQFAVHAPPIEAEVDAARLSQALAHLIADVAGVDATGSSPHGPTGDSTIVVAAAQRGDVVRIEVRGPFGGGDPVHQPVVRGVVRQHGGVLQTHDVPGAGGGSAYVLEVPVSASGAPVTDRPHEATGNETTMVAVDEAAARGSRRAPSAGEGEGGTGAEAALPSAREAGGAPGDAGPSGALAIPAQADGRPQGRRRARHSGQDDGADHAGDAARDGGAPAHAAGAQGGAGQGGAPTGHEGEDDGYGAGAPGGGLPFPAEGPGAGAAGPVPPTGLRPVAPGGAVPGPAVHPAAEDPARRQSRGGGTELVPASGAAPTGPAALEAAPVRQPGAPLPHQPVPAGRRARRAADSGSGDRAIPHQQPHPQRPAEALSPAAPRAVTGRTPFALPPAAADRTEPPAGAPQLPALPAVPEQAGGAQPAPVPGTGRRRARPVQAQPQQTVPPTHWPAPEDAALPEPAPTGRRRARRAAAEERAAAAMADSESTGTFVAGPEGLVAQATGPDAPAEPPAAAPADAAEPEAVPAPTGRRRRARPPQEQADTPPPGAPTVPSPAGPQPDTARPDTAGALPRERPAAQAPAGPVAHDPWGGREPWGAPAGPRPADGVPEGPATAPAAAGGDTHTGSHAKAPGQDDHTPPAGHVRSRESGGEPRRRPLHLPTADERPGQAARQADGSADAAGRRASGPQARRPLGPVPPEAAEEERAAAAQTGARSTEARPWAQQDQAGQPEYAAPREHAQQDHAPTPPPGPLAAESRARRAVGDEAGGDQDQGQHRAFSVRTLGQGVPFSQQFGEQPRPNGAGGPHPAPPGGGPSVGGRRRRLAEPPGEDARPSPPAEPPTTPAAGTPRPGGPAAAFRGGHAPHLRDSSEGRAFAVSAPDEGSEGPEPLDGPGGAVEVVDHTPPPRDDELPPEPLDNPRRLLVWPAPDVSTQQALSDRGYRPVIVNSREEVDAQIAAYPAALFVDPLTGPITRTALQSLRQAAVAAEVPVMVTAGLGQAARDAAYGADPAVLLKALAPRDSEVHPARVLLTEENDAIAGALTASLERRGMQVARAASDADAVGLAAQVQPNLVVMDLMQVRRRRAGIVDWLRANGLLNRTPLVVYTSADMDPAQWPRLAAGENVLFLAERSTSPDVQARIVDLLTKIGAN